MKKYIKSILVIILTFITVIAISSLKISYPANTAYIDDDKDNAKVNSDTGYIFDDYNKNVNIKLNN